MTQIKRVPLNALFLEMQIAWLLLARQRGGSRWTLRRQDFAGLNNFPGQIALQDGHGAAHQFRYVKSLFEDLKTRLASGPVKFRLVVQLPNAGDVTKDPSLVWPEDRKTIDIGLTLQRHFPFTLPQKPA